VSVYLYAIRWLQDRLTGEWEPATRITAEAKAIGIPWGTLYAARLKVGERLTRPETHGDAEWWRLRTP
jgi:hypothetical protein